MDWPNILGGALDGAGLALSIIAVILAYREVTSRSSDDPQADMRRQVEAGTFAVVACALAVAYFAVRHIGL